MLNDYLIKSYFNDQVEMNHELKRMCHFFSRDVNYVKNIIDPILDGKADMVIGSRFIDKKSNEECYPYKDYHVMYVGEIEKILIKE